jgi:hypothetical protein
VGDVRSRAACEIIERANKTLVSRYVVEQWRPVVSSFGVEGRLLRTHSSNFEFFRGLANKSVLRQCEFVIVSFNFQTQETFRCSMICYRKNLVKVLLELLHSFFVLAKNQNVVNVDAQPHFLRVIKERRSFDLRRTESEVFEFVAERHVPQSSGLFYSVK